MVDSCSFSAAVLDPAPATWPVLALARSHWKTAPYARLCAGTQLLLLGGEVSRRGRCSRSSMNHGSGRSSIYGVTSYLANASETTGVIRSIEIISAISLTGNMTLQCNMTLQ